MKDTQLLPGSEPLCFQGNAVGVLVCHGFTGTTQSMRWRGLTQNRGFEPPYGAC